MKKRILIPLLIILAAGIAVFSVMIGDYMHHTGDALQYNDIIQTVRKNIDDPGRIADAGYDFPVYVFDEEGFLLYPEGSPVQTISQAIDEGLVLLPVHEGGRYLATAAIPDPARRSYDTAGKRLVTAAAVMMLFFILAAVMFTVYVSRSIIAPFRRLKAFAGRIASGDLDSPLMMEKDNIFGAFTESFDIMREELKSARQREMQLKMKERELVAELSHDLKTPIAGIDTICDVLSVKLTDGYALGKVEDIKKKTHQMNMLVSDLFTAALDDLGEMTVSCTEESSAVLHEIVTASDPRSLTRDTPVPECLIHIDKSRMTQIIGNIIGNSYKYAGTPIDISYTISGDFLKMSVTDHGAGVPEDELGLITNKFYRGRSVRSSDKSGSGLGLYIASELMAKMNGELICSSDGRGFTASLMILLSR